jgi:hypothetical protein
MKATAAAAILISFASIGAASADDAVFPGGLIIASMVGIAEASTPDHGPPPPPEPYYFGYTGYAGRGPFGSRCWIEPRQVWNGYGTIVRRVRYCD